MKKLIMAISGLCLAFTANAKTYEEPIFLDGIMENVYIQGKKVPFHSYNKDLKFFKSTGEEIKLFNKHTLGYKHSENYSFIYEYTLDLNENNDIFVQYNNGKTEVRVVFVAIDKIVLDKKQGAIPYHKVQYDLNEYEAQQFFNEVEVLQKEQRYNNIKEKIGSIF